MKVSMIEQVIKSLLFNAHIFVFLFLFFVGCTRDEKTDRLLPNIVIIVADDLGWNNVGFHGSDIETPTIDNLAREGMVLNRFYSAPVCSPTRAGLMTGNYPDRFNLRNHVFSPTHVGSIPENEEFLPLMLEKAGYKERAAFGKWHLGHSHYIHHPNSRGFTYFYGHYNGAIDYFSHKRDAELDWHENNNPNYDSGYSTDLIGSAAVNFIRKAESNSPFFAYVAFNAPHSPMQAKEEDLNYYQKESITIPEEYATGGARSGERELGVYGKKGRGNTLHQTYSAMVRDLDINIGKILNALQEKGIEKNTFIWFLSDNGGVTKYGGNNYPLRGEKHTEWEGGVRVVSLVKWPGIILPGTSSDELMAYIDIFPTIEEIVRIKNSKKTDGISVFPAFMGNSLPGRTIFLGNTGIVSREWKMNRGELFRIEEDPNEKNNLANEYPDVVKRLNSMLKQYARMLPDEKPPRQPENWIPPKDWTMPGE